MPFSAKWLGLAPSVKAEWHGAPKDDLARHVHTVLQRILTETPPDDGSADDTVQVL